MSGTNFYVGSAAIAELARHMSEFDAGSSSHWRAMHRDIALEDGKLKGAVGFGGYRARKPGLRSIAEWVLQIPYRIIAARYSSFRKIDRDAAKIAKRQGRVYDLDMLRQAISLSMLSDRAGQAFDARRPLLVIGDGYGTMTSLLAMARPEIKIILINLTQTLIADLISMQSGIPDIRFALVSDESSLELALNEPNLQVLALRADNWPLLLNLDISLAINIASMQEMRPDTIKQYFDVMRHGTTEGTIFYCCNRNEKILPGGELVRFSEYPWEQEDEIYFDEKCGWHSFYYDKSFPFYHSYDGEHVHRLAKLRPRNQMNGEF